MPELPEVETIKRGLEPLLISQKIKTVSFDWLKSFPNDPDMVDEFLINSTIIKVRRRGKVLIIDLNNDYSLLVHLKMTGQLVYRSQKQNFGAGHPNDSLIGKLPDKSSRVTIELNNGAKLFFNDQRKFGWMKLIPTSEIANIDFFKKIGPEPLEATFTPKVLKDRLSKRPNSKIKAALLDQTVIAGIGNIYADESLWGAKIHPARLVKSLTNQEIEQLYEEIIFVLKLSIKKGGSTDKNYVNHEGKRGSYLDFARVFRRQNLDCPSCGQTIEKIKLAGRGTHFCPNCQKL
jgi:formamidopyrimidine-DNA glycosylase